jgi:hypothetical protein
MIKAFEFFFTLLQLGPIFVLLVSSNPLSPQVASSSRRVQTEEPRSTTVFS